MNMPKKILTIFLFSFFLFSFTLFTFTPVSAHASPWAKKDGYLHQTGGKFSHGLKHSLFSWMSLWTESREPGYKKQWEGFSAGFGKTVVYTAGGLIQLVTFPVPADFPDFGIGMHIPGKECPARHEANYVPPAKNPLSKKSAEAAAPKPALKPLTSPSTAPAPAEIPAAAPVILEAKAPVETSAKEKSELEKAQEAELEAAASAQIAAEPALKETSAPALPTKNPETDSPHESNEDIVGANPQAAEDEDEEDLWDEDYDAVDERSAAIDPESEPE